MRRLLNKGVGPPVDADGDSFRYRHETGHKSYAVDYVGWKEAIFSYRRGNNLEIPADMMAVAEDQLCGSLPPELCQYEEGDRMPVDIRIGIDAVKRWIGAVAGLVLTTGYVEQPEAERRAAICVRCPYNVNVMGGCSYGCQKLVEFMTPGMLAKKTSQDRNLRSCAVCGCFNTVAVHFPMPVLHANETTEIQAKYPIAFCWKSRQSPNYINDASGATETVD